MAIKTSQRISLALIGVGIVLAILFVSGMTHPVSAQGPSNMASYSWHHRWIVVGFAISMAGALILLVTEMFRRSRTNRVTELSTTPPE